MAFSLEEILKELMNNMETAPANFTEYKVYKRFQRRELYLEDIDAESAREFINTIVEFNKDDKGIPVNKRQPITIYINSCGGTVQDGYAIVDAITLSKTPVYTVGLSAYSMGALILLAGHKRIMYPSGSVMFHEGSASIFGDAGKVKDTMRFYEKQLEIAKQMMFSRTKITPELYEKKEDNDWYLTADEALELGVVDELATDV